MKAKETNTEPVVEEVEDTSIQEEMRMDKKVTIKSIAPWVTGARRVTTIGDISIQPNGTVILTREEVVAQAQNNNKLLVGTDGYGSHATWYFDDVELREYLDFDRDGAKQLVVNKEALKNIFKSKTKKEFENAITSLVVTRAEKCALMEFIKEAKINEYDKIEFCKSHTGFKV